MSIKSLLFTGAIAAAVAAVDIPLPSLLVPQCPGQGTAVIDRTAPDRTAFPLTTVSLCYTQTALQLNFTAFQETNYYYNASQGTNGDIYNYEVMEAFIYHGRNDPQTYLEFEVNPNNVTYQAVVYNPTKVRAANAPFDHFFVTDPSTDGFSASTTLDKAAQTWWSSVQIPLALFNLDGHVQGSQWRMNFFRTITSPSMYPNQTLGAWSPPNQPSFHITPYFGHVAFI